MPDLYERIQELTVKRQISGVELGKMLGLKKSPLTDWKNQQSKPTLDQFAKICEIFAVSPEWLLTGKEAKDLTPEEQLLVDYYRAGNDAAQQAILANAKTLSEQLPREQESSASRIG